MHTKLKKKYFIGGEGNKRKSIEDVEIFTSGLDVDAVSESPKDYTPSVFV